MRKTFHIFTLGLALLLVLTSCSTKKNTASTRWWHSFTARYNTYFNGHEAFLEGEKAKLNGNKDNYTEMIPVFLVGNVKTRSTGRSNYETAITKCEKAIQLHSIKRRPQVSASKKRSAKTKAYLSRKEFNPFLKNAWLLMGEAQFQKGEFLEAASTFSYITRLYAPEPEVVAEARQWLARCYSQTGWYYDAEDALQKVRRDSVSKRISREADITQADLLLRQERFAEALPYLREAARHTKGKVLKARMYFLLGQVNQHLGNNAEAGKAYAKCIRMSPPFEMAFNARIRQTEVLASEGSGSRKKMISKLKRMARSDNNKDYLDQVYYAMGNIYLTEKDTLQAITAYERGRSKSTRNGVEKGVLLLKLGEIYWDRRKFDKAQTCYTEALGLIDKTREGYDEITRRSKVLDKLVPFTSAISLQDSLQELSRMSEKDRNAAIDRVIEALKKKEAEERRAKADSAAQANGADGGNGTAANRGRQTTVNSRQSGQTWYFYNPTQVMQGKQDFRKQWGNRKNEDNWRRSNRTTLAPESEGYDYEAEDSLAAIADSIAAAGGEAVDEKQAEADSIANDPHHREYYLKQIPFTEEARAASDLIIMDGLYNAGVIEKDDLEDFPLAESSLTRITTQYPTYEQLSETYYQLFLLYQRWGRSDKANAMRNYMATQWPDNEHTRTITDPDYELLSRHGREMEDSLYTRTYDAFRRRDNAAVQRGFDTSTAKFPKGVNRPKFIFVHALSRLNTAPTKELTAELRGLVTEFPDADVSPLASMIVKGLESGRTPGSGGFDLGSLWNRRSAAADSTAADAAKGRELSPEREAQYLFVLAYPSDSVDSNKLLYEMAHFNFTTFVVRGFDMNFVKAEGITQFRVSGFSSFDEAHSYAQRVYASADLRPFLQSGRVLIISKDNLDMIGINFSYDDYEKFYEKNFAPMKLNPALPIDDAEPVEQYYEDEEPGGTTVLPTDIGTATDAEAGAADESAEPTGTVEEGESTDEQTETETTTDTEENTETEAEPDNNPDSTGEDDGETYEDPDSSGEDEEWYPE